MTVAKFLQSLFHYFMLLFTIVPAVCVSQLSVEKAIAEKNVEKSIVKK